MNRLLLFVAAIVVNFTFGSCAEDSEEIIPNVRFTGQINLINQDPNYAQYQCFTAEHDSYGKRLGLYGVVIFKLHSEEFYAFDLMCPHEKHVSSLVNIDEDNIGYCTCPTCESEFSVNNEYGGVITGPSKWPLKKYNAEVTDDGTLHIWN